MFMSIIIVIIIIIIMIIIMNIITKVLDQETLVRGGASEIRSLSTGIGRI